MCVRVYLVASEETLEIYIHTHTHAQTHTYLVASKETFELIARNKPGVAVVDFWRQHLEGVESRIKALRSASIFGG